MSKNIHVRHQNRSEDGGSAETGRPAIVGLHFRVGKKIGEGSFGVIYEGINVVENAPVAIKFEPRKSEAPQLRDEYKAYRILAGTEGIPNVHYYGQEGSYNCLVMELLGHSLEYLFDCCSRRYSVQTVALLAIQMIGRVQSIHEHHLIYRDIKPDNFLIGRRERSHVIYMVDFGMAKHYRDPKTKVHIPYKERKSLSGTARYMSINTHLGREQSRRDDLEALGNVFMYFLRGSLPWQGLKAPTNKLKYEKIGEKKQQVSVHELCQGFPEEFSSYIYYVRKLAFEDNPDYEYLKGLFMDLVKRLEIPSLHSFDWIIMIKSQKSDASSVRRPWPRSSNTNQPPTQQHKLENLTSTGEDANNKGPKLIAYPKKNNTSVRQLLSSSKDILTSGSNNNQIPQNYSSTYHNQNVAAVRESPSQDPDTNMKSTPSKDYLPNNSNANTGKDSRGHLFAGYKSSALISRLTTGNDNDTDHDNGNGNEEENKKPFKKTSWKTFFSFCFLKKKKKPRDS